MVRMTSALSNEVKATRRMPGQTSLRPRAAAQPPPSGMLTSMTATCGLVLRASRIASGTRLAVPTTTRVSSVSTAALTDLRITAWSSRRSTVTLAGAYGATGSRSASLVRLVTVALLGRIITLAVNERPMPARHAHLRQSH